MQNNGILSQSHPSAKLLLTGLIAMLSLLVFFILGALLAVFIFGKQSFTGILSGNSLSMADNIGLLKYLQLVQSLGIFVAPSLLLAFLFGQKVFNYLYLNRKPLWSSAIIAVLLIWSAAPLINIIANWNANLVFPEWLTAIENWMRSKEDAAEELISLFLVAETPGQVLYNVFLIGILPAIGEELLFRGIIQKVFYQWTRNHHASIWITAILFSALHLQFFGFVPRMLLGALFGYLLVWSGNLWIPILAHFINNTTAVIAYQLYGTGVINVDPDKLGTESNSFVVMLVSALLISVLVYLFIKLEKRHIQLKPKGITDCNMSE
jgi:uncharacterized protein